MAFVCVAVCVCLPVGTGGGGLGGGGGGLGGGGLGGKGTEYLSTVMISSTRTVELLVLWTVAASMARLTTSATGCKQQGRCITVSNMRP